MAAVGDALAAAQAAHALVQTNARLGARAAQEALGQARRRGDAEAQVAALHALGFARRELGDARASRTLAAAVRLADAHGFHERAALARRPLAICLADAGRTSRAVREIDAACAALHGQELARSEVYRIAVLGMAGRAPASLADSDRALRILRGSGDTVWEARLRKNRGVLLAQRGDALAAEADLLRAAELYEQLGAHEAAVGARVVLADVALLRGDLPACLERADAIGSHELAPVHEAGLELLRAQALIAARLTAEAREPLARAQTIWQRAGIDEPSARLEVIRLTLQAGLAEQALELARQAQRWFATRRRDLHAARARGLELAAAIAAGSVQRRTVTGARRAAETLRQAGWSEEALRLRLAVAHAELALAAPQRARDELASCGSQLRRLPVSDRVQAEHVRALLALAEGDPAAAQRAARRGLRLLEEHRAALGAADLRASASAIGVALAQLGLRIELQRARPASMLAWAELLRASALRLPAVTPLDSAPLRAHATELRRITLELARAQRGGRVAHSLAARQAALESQIRQTARHLRSDGPSAGAGVQPAHLSHTLGDGALVEFVALDGQLHAITVVAGRCERHALGPLHAVTEELEWLRFGLRRGAASAQALDRLLLAPLLARIGQRPLVVVPTGRLHELPWPLLPSLHGRALTVTPSAATWMALRARPRRRGGMLLVAGPRLRHAGAEVGALAATHPDATLLRGREATVAAVMSALDGARVAHLACHGHFRADSPLFSALELADGPLNVYELQRLRRPPELVVLSACDLAVSAAAPGDELLGFAAALLGIGARTIVASVVPVADSAAKRLMLALHRELDGGATPAAALARAQAGLVGRDPVLAGFQCLGADGP